MIRYVKMLCAVLLVSALLTACEWNSGDSFNTSQLGGLTVSFSGYYQGTVSGKSGNAVIALTVLQSGSTLEVYDNLGNQYEGTLGSAQTYGSGADTILSGTTIADSQVSFSGTDHSAGRTVDFAGVISVVSIENIQGTTTITSTGDTSVDTDLDNETGSDESSSDLDIDTSTVDISTSTSSNSDSNVSNFDGDSSSESAASITTYALSEANIQYKLQGVWMEDGGASAVLSMTSAGSVGSISFATTTVDSSFDTTGADVSDDLQDEADTAAEDASSSTGT